MLLVSHVKSRQTFYKDVVSIKPADPDPATCEVAGHSLHQAVLGCTAQLSLVVRDKFGNLCSMGDDKQTRLAVRFPLPVRVYTELLRTIFLARNTSCKVGQLIEFNYFNKLAALI